MLRLVFSLHRCSSRPSPGKPRQIAVLAAFPPVRSGLRVGIGASLQLYPKRRALQLERLPEEMFQVPAVGVPGLAERNALDDDQRRGFPPPLRAARPSA